ncbi:hypothetical protein PHACT_11160 [Pseudohongiella acticola]|uniref:Uncharacterized protein n=1 Tax=Pseudohongiella acticola TaxID=1524254 RepID=A0A1E8CMV0_9GAMM|nr:hypothetical protein [Pseudohongiella acticola]OFE13625.1 hypothetical protein PHACT_11160 [Pseudohongiella acticola]
MVASYFLSTLFLLCLMLAGLFMAQQASQRQGQHVSRLSRLSALESRRSQVHQTARALQQMDTDGEVLALLYGSLLDDLHMIKTLDPVRADLEKQIKEAETASKQTSSGNAKAGSSAAVATEEELTMTQRHIQRAMKIFVSMYKSDKISASQYQSCRDKLRMLGLRVAVNSCLLMAQRAVDSEDAVKAMSCFRRAESFLSMKGLPGAEIAEKRSYIKAEREKVISLSEAGRGLLLMAAQE